MDAECQEGEQGEEEALDDDMVVPPTFKPGDLLKNDGLGTAGDDVSQPKKRVARKSLKSDAGSDVMDTVVDVNLKDAPKWLLEDPKFNKIANKLGKISRCFMSMNAVENLEKRKPIGHQLRGVPGPGFGDGVRVH